LNVSKFEQKRDPSCAGHKKKAATNIPGTTSTCAAADPASSLLLLLLPLLMPLLVVVLHSFTSRPLPHDCSSMQPGKKRFQSYYHL
jgi:hypothetical protein